MDKRFILIMTMIVSVGIYCFASSVRARDDSIGNKKIGWGIKRVDNTAPDLVKRMIEDGHIVGNQLPQI